MVLEGIEEATGDKGQQALASRSGPMAMATARGVVHSPPRYVLPTGETSGLNADPSNQPSIFARRIGIRYVIQTLANGIPLLAADVLTLSAIIVAGRYLFAYFGWRIGIDLSACLIPIATGFVLINLELGLYPGVRLGPIEELRRLAVSVTCMFVVWAVGLAILTGSLVIQSGFLLVVYAACLLSLPVVRAWSRRFLAHWTEWGVPVLVCGNDQAAFKLHQWLKTNRQLGFRPQGVICDPDAPCADESEADFVGAWSDIRDVAARKWIYWAIIVPPAESAGDLSTRIANDLYTIPHIHILSELTGLPDTWGPHQQLDGLSGIHLQQNLMLPLPRVTKRLMDLAASLIGGLFLLPFLFYIAMAVKMSSRGPILYGHERIGRGGKRFKAWKFRTMFENSSEVLEMYFEQHPDLHEEWKKDHKLKYDPRITRIGRFMRKTSLDELPQLWNVIRGQMSLVGPRPIVTAEVVKYGLHFGLYTMVKPGITGLWQVSGRNNTTYDERVQLDAYYVRNWSPWMDLYLLLRTIRIVLFAKGAY
jgi:Undecaprenyl-phosphate galactose phosphotransferase WbaP